VCPEKQPLLWRGLERSWIPDKLRIFRNDKRTAILAAAMLLSMLNLLTAQTPDENEFMLWQLDSNLAWTDAIAIHPNGNLFCHNKGQIYYEVDFQTGKIINNYPGY
jgi:hypothetical protein